MTRVSFLEHIGISYIHCCVGINNTEGTTNLLKHYTIYATIVYIHEQR